MTLLVFYLKQYLLEHIYLSNEDDLNSLIHETSDVFQYVKYQAERGDIQSQVYAIYFFIWCTDKVVMVSYG